MLVKEVDYKKSMRMLNNISNEKFSKKFNELSIGEKDEVVTFGIDHEIIIMVEKEVSLTKSYTYRDHTIMFNVYGHMEYSVFDGEEDMIFGTYAEAQELVDKLFFDSYGYFVDKHGYSYWY